MNIRQATLVDAEAIAAVHVDSWQAAYRGYISDAVLNDLSYEKKTKMWQELLQQGVYIWVIEDEQQIIGFASVCRTRDEDADPTKVLEISAIYLLKDYWQKGLGKQLCQTIFEFAEKSKFNEITLWVLSANLSARNFYKKLKFYTRGEIKTDHIGGESMQVIRYRRKISL